MMADAASQDRLQPNHYHLNPPREAPVENGSALLFPASTQAVHDIHANQRWFSDDSAGHLPNELRALRCGAMTDLLAQAVAYSGGYLEVPAMLLQRIAGFTAVLGSETSPLVASNRSGPANITPGPSPVILSGHQPTLYHPGIWFKHFVLHSLAEKLNAIPIHLIIDNDLVGSADIRVPQAVADQVRLVPVPLDAEYPEIPFESREIVDREFFEDFPSRLRRALPMIAEPLGVALWNEPVATMNFGQALASRRHRFEMRTGLQTLEVPLSQLCQTPYFARFTSWIILRAQEFAGVHNRMLADFRQQHRIRSRAHPFPELLLDDEWIEVPFWIWDRHDPRRRRLFCRQEATQVSLTDRQNFMVRVPSSELMAELLRCAETGTAIRPRALTTTMYARLFLGDYFLHGLGGAKYDELTDLLIHQFLEIPAPAFGFATATFLLPNTPYISQLETQLSELENTARRMLHQPDRFIDANDPPAIELAHRKQNLIRDKDSFANQKAFRLAIAAVDQQLRERLIRKTAALDSERQRLARVRDENRLWGARDYSLACFPESLADDLRRLADRTLS